MILVAPDAFKGTFTAAQVAAAIGRGVEAAGRAARRMPLADGGEGTASVLLAALGGETRGAVVSDPLGRPRRAGFALVEDGGTAILDAAEAGGLPLVGPPTPATAWSSSTFGTGELIAAAAATGAAVVVVAAGGSASTDGGAGALAALGVPKGSDPFGTSAEAGARIVVLCDVETVWEQCAATFGPQKGADRATVSRLSARLHAFASELPRDPRGVPGGGAAGGLAGGLWAGAGAALERGAPWVMGAVGFDAALAEADALIVGEGALDATSAQGKLVGEACARAAAAGVPVDAIVGRDDGGAALHARLGLRAVREAGTLRAITAAAAALGRD